ncbi:MAG TPA: translation initiation factor IF-2 [Thermoanaerobaculia bacterium]|jgi:translation initiation factor IF-2|nr:translation initiation factor IF-2 [Thermoanaerobaculia bacterium]
MGKIRVQDLATMMGISNQDLVFKLKSIGVRVEGDDASIDTDIVQAILQGKKLPHPREVILRDEPAAPAEAVRGRRTGAGPAPAPPAARRPQANPLRPQRPRTLIQKVEPRIQNMPVTERPAMPVEDMPGMPETPVLPPPAPSAPLHQAQAQPSAAVEVAEPAGHEEAAVPVPEVAAARPEMATPPTPPPPPAKAAPPAPQGRVHPSMRSPIPAGRPSGPPPSTPPRRDGRDGQQPSGRPDSRDQRGGPGGQGRPGQQQPSGRPGGPGGYGGGGGGGTRPQGPGGPGGPGARPSGPGGIGGGGSRPQSPGGAPGMSLSAEEARRREAEERDKRKKKPVRKAGPRPVEEKEDLTGFKGTLEDLEGAEDDLGAPGASRRRRRAARKEEEEGGKLLTFKKAAPSGTVMISEGMTVRDFAEKLNVKARDLMKALFNRGILANINQVLDAELAQKLAADLGVDAMVVSFEEEVQLREELQGGEQPQAGRAPRAPVVTIMGHVDHGKTSLLDRIRSSRLTEAEHGGITQHIGAYHVDVNGRSVVFLDTPGHEAFTMMRSRGARVTDIVVLVVAADDGVMPQTIEAIDHARAAKVPIVVAINKIDKANANLDRVKRELSDRGLMPEDWGGDTVMVPVSALKGEGIPTLLEMLLLTADILELRANPEIQAQGAVLEARKEVGRGIVSTVLVQNGTLKVGDLFVSGATWGRVRSMSDDTGKRVQQAGPSTPVEVTGFNDLPDAGDLLQVVEDEIKARGIAEYRQLEQRRKELAPAHGRLSLEQLFNRIQEGEAKELAVVVKADVQGSLEVLRDALGKQSTDKVKVQVLHAGVGAITTNDVLLASASKAIIIGFNVRPERTAVELAEKEEVDIRLHTVIYELIDELRKAMTGLLEPTFREVAAGRAEVRDTFKVPKVGTIAGCHVVEGVIHRSDSVRLVRDNRVVFEGKIASLRRFKDDASEVRTGFDCGIGLDRFQDFKPGDFIEAYTNEEVAPVL